MAVVLGTNSGFVTVAPTSDPAGSNGGIDTNAFVTKHTSPSGAAVITEIGWWCDTASQAANFDVGLYAADGATVPGEAGTRLFVSTNNAKGTTSGWKRVSVNWSIASSTAYWLGLQLDDTATQTFLNIGTSGGAGYDVINSQTSLPSTFGGGTLADADGMLALYAVWKAASGPANLKSYNTNVESNIKTINTNPIANVKSLNTNT